MKKLLTMALLALTVASCSKKPGASDLPGEELNSPTYATFKFNIGSGSGNRAAADYNPGIVTEDDVKDAAIGKLQLLIFNASTQALEYNGVIEAKATSKTVLLTAGKKKIFFIANGDNLTALNTSIAPATFKPGEAGTTLTDFYAFNFDAGTPQQTGVDQGTVARSFDFAKLYTLSNTTVGSEAGLPMSNTNEITYTLVSGITEEQAKTGTPSKDGISTNNNFSIQLYYMVAKARLVAGTNMLNDGTNGKPIIANVKYSIRNLARATNYVQNVPTAGNPQSYYFSKTFADQTAFNAEFDYASNMAANATATPGAFLYVPENNSAQVLRGQSSYFAIEVNFEPIVITASNFDLSSGTIKYTTKALASADPTNKAYIYTIKEVSGIPAGMYFITRAELEKAAWTVKNSKDFTEANRTDAKALVLDTDYSSFTKGISYYRVDLGDGTTAGAETQYGVLRSNSYTATINKITGPGVPNDGGIITDPDKPISAKTYIQATIVPAKWNAITQSADL